MNSTEKIIDVAREAIRQEGRVLENLAKTLDHDFARCVETIFQSKGRVVLSGIGKSALVAQKISATLNSTGTPALFMHAADAIHGDMGMLQSEDTLICISKSGESPEIKVLLPFIHNLGNTIIGMVSQRESYLGKEADLTLWTPVEREADPNNLAPTASTTAQMAMGDALAVALLAMRGFSPSDFARYHPGGALGKQLYLTVGDLALHNPMPKVYLNDGIRKIIVEISSRRMGATAVLDEKEQLCGIVTDGDLRRMLEDGGEVSHLLARDIMTSNPKSIPYDAMAVRALGVMRENSISQLVVVEGRVYRGMIHLHDLIKEGLI